MCKHRAAVWCPSYYTQLIPRVGFLPSLIALQATRTRWSNKRFAYALRGLPQRRAWSRTGSKQQRACWPMTAHSLTN